MFTTTEQAKRFANKVMKRMELDGLKLTFPQTLEAIAAGFEYRDWNTYSAELKNGSALVNKVEKVQTIKTAENTFLWNEKIIQSPINIGKSGYLSMLYQGRKGNNALADMVCASFYKEGKSNRVGIVSAKLEMSGLPEILTECKSKDKSQYICLENKGDHRVNPFDLPLGMKFPDEKQKSRLNYLLEFFMDDQNYELAQAMITHIYTIFSNNGGSTKPWVKGVLPEIDGLILQGVQDISWWDISDKLFRENQIELAKQAQAQAVPRFEDIIKINWDLVEAKLYKRVDSDFLRNLKSRISQTLQGCSLFSGTTNICLENKSYIYINTSRIDYKFIDLVSTSLFNLLSNQFFCLDIPQDNDGFTSDLYHNYYINKYYRNGLNLIQTDLPTKSTMKNTLLEACCKIKRGKGNVLLAIDKFPYLGKEFSKQIDMIAFQRKDSTDEDRATIRENYAYSPDIGIISKEWNVFSLYEPSNPLDLKKTVLDISPKILWQIRADKNSGLVKDQLKKELGAKQALDLLASYFPQGSVENKLEEIMEQTAQEQEIENNSLDIYGLTYQGAAQKLAKTLIAGIKVK